MAKPEEYKEKDAVKLKCVHQYTVRNGLNPATGENFDDTVLEAGKVYSVSPRSAVHLMRKLRAIYAPLTAQDKKDGKKRGAYVGDAPHFEEVVAKGAKPKMTAEVNGEE